MVRVQIPLQGPQIFFQVPACCDYLEGHINQNIDSSAATFVRIIIHLEANVAECIQHHNRGGLKQFSAMLVFIIAMVMTLMLPLMTMIVVMIMEVSGYLNPDAMVGIVVAFSSQTHLKLALHFHYHQDDNNVQYIGEN